MTIGLHHVAVSVRDFDKALTFYTQALGLELVQRSELKDDNITDRIIGLKDVSAKVAILKASNVFLELWEYQNPEPEDLRSRPCDHGYTHIAVQVEDISTEHDRLSAFGVEFVGDPVSYGEGAWAVYGRDPCGNIIELIETKTGGVA